LIIGAIRHQLDNLGLEYIDLFLIHTPWRYRNGNVSQNDYSINAETDRYGNAIFDDYAHTEMWQEARVVKMSKTFEKLTIHNFYELEKAVDMGLVKNIGVSNFDQNQVDKILKHCRIRPLNNQIECHPFLAQDDLIRRDLQRNKICSVFLPSKKRNKNRKNFVPV
jgi:aldehyde reductase